MLGDAFNDIAVPYHLTTKEFNELVADHLSPRGLYLVNVVDGKDYDFLRSFIKTLTKTFRNVGLMTVPGQPVQGERATFVVVAANRPLPRLQTIVGLDRLQPFLDEKDTVELTDDHVPVDQLLAPVYGDSLEEHEARRRRVAREGRSVDSRRAPGSELRLLDQLDPVPVRVAHEAQARAALAHAVGRLLGLDALARQPLERRVEVVGADRDVPVGRAQVVGVDAVL